MISKTKFTRNVGVKFHEDGTARAFPGNTVICHLPKDSPQFKYLIEFQNQLKASPFASHYAFLPPSSFHMTVFEGVLEERRKPSVWTNKLPTNAPLDEVDKLFMHEWQQIPKPDHFQVRPSVFYTFGTIGFRYQPIDDAMNKKMRDFRDLLADRFGLRFGNHKLYSFHTTLGYQILNYSFIEFLRASIWMRKMNKELIKKYGILTTNAPELCFFTDMTCFAPSRAEAKQNVQL